MGDSWYNTGYDGIQGEEDRIAQSMIGVPMRFWLEVGSFKEMVFLDDVPFCIYEHNPKMNGNYKNWFTCLKGIDPKGAPCCEALGQNDRYYVGYYTVVDLSKWSDKRGNVYQYELKFLPARVNTLKKFKMKKDDRKTLVGCLYKVSRTGNKSPACGEEFEYQRDVDLAKLFQVATYKGKSLVEMWAKGAADPNYLEQLRKVFQLKIDAEKKPIPQLPIFNYGEILKPKAYEEVKSMLGAVEPDDDNKSGGDKPTSFGGTKTDDVPF